MITLGTPIQVTSFKKHKFQIVVDNKKLGFDSEWRRIAKNKASMRSAPKPWTSQPDGPAPPHSSSFIDGRYFRLSSAAPRWLNKELSAHVATRIHREVSDTDGIASARSLHR